MESIEKRRYTNSLWKAYFESCKEIEKTHYKKIISVLASFKDEAITIKKLSELSQLNLRTISKLVAKKGFLFRCTCPKDKREDYTPDDVKIKLTKEGYQSLRLL